MFFHLSWRDRTIEMQVRETKYLENPQRKRNCSLVNRIHSPNALW